MTEEVEISRQNCKLENVYTPIISSFPGKVSSSLKCLEPRGIRD